MALAMQLRLVTREPTDDQGSVPWCLHLQRTVLTCAYRLAPGIERTAGQPLDARQPRRVAPG